MTARDPDLQAAVDRAARELARRLEPIVTIRDVDAFAAAYLEDLYAEGWRPIPRPQPITGQQPGDPATYERGAETARRALLRTLTHEAIDADSYGDPGEETR